MTNVKPSIKNVMTCEMKVTKKKTGGYLNSFPFSKVQFEKIEMLLSNRL